jgi:cytoskeletal protein CcmA (bactofilin family)
MFNRDQKDFNVKEAETIIGASVKVKGNFHGQGNIIIEGEVEGNIKTNKYLLVGSGAKITASIEASEAKVSGIINGNFSIKGYLEISSGANITGDIAASELSIERGAIINGKCTMTNGKNIKIEQESK